MNNRTHKKTICITGGHLTPALAVIEEIQKQKKDWTIVFVGRQEEKHIIEKLHLPFFAIHSGRIQRYISLSILLEIILIPIGFIESCLLCLRHRPDCVFSFGGYVGFGVIVAAWLFGIPTVIHEQTHTLGLSNRIASQLASKILVSFSDTKGILHKPNVVVTGLPIRHAFFHPPIKPTFPVPTDKPIVYITGGTTGAVSLNDLLFPSIASLTLCVTVIHQTGQQSYTKALEVRKQLKKEMQERYILHPYISTEDVAWIMQHMTLLVGRSGANTAMETMLVAKPAIFVPLPWAGGQEQMQNALWYQRVGDGVIVNQKTATPEKLLETILQALKKIPTKQGTKQHGPVSQAAASIVHEIASVLS